MTKQFTHEIEVYGVTLTVKGEYDPPVPATRLDPAEGALISIGPVCVQGTAVDIHDLLCERTKARIEEKIERIEENL